MTKNKDVLKDVEITSPESDVVISNNKRKIIKIFVEKSLKMLPSLKRMVSEGKKDKEDIIKALIDMNELMDMEDEDTGKPITRSDLEAMTITELTEMFEEALKYMEKNI